MKCVLYQKKFTGANKNIGVKFNMNSLFEQFILFKIQKAIDPSGNINIYIHGG